MTLTITIAGIDATSFVRLQETEIVEDSSTRSSTARIIVALFNQAVYDTAGYDEDDYTLDVTEGAEVIMTDEGGTRQFAGYIVRVSWDWHGPNQYVVSCDCVDYSVHVATTLVSGTFSSTTDRAVIQNISASLPSGFTAPSSSVANIANLANFEFENRSIRDVMDDICKLTGGQWRIDYNKVVRYYASGQTAAPFSLTDVTADVNGTTVVGYRLEQWSKDISQLVNRAVVIGGLISGGVQASATRNNTTSQATYGIFARTYVERDLETSTMCGQRADAIIAAHANAQYSGSFTVFYHDGLAANQTISITHQQYGISGTYTIRRLTKRWSTKSDVVYVGEFGSEVADVETLIKSLDVKVNTQTEVPEAVPPDLSVTNAKIVSIEAEKITAGTIDAVIEMTAPRLTITAGSTEVKINDTVFFQAKNTSTNQTVTIGGGFISIFDSDVATAINTLSDAGMTVTNSSGVSTTVGPTQVSIGGSGGSLTINGSQLMTTRRTGWSTATGTATRTSFDTTTVTLAALAERVKAMIDDLHSTAGHGLIGA